jgi:hypothetical protein
MEGNWWIVALFVAAFAALAAWQYYAAKKRRQALKSWASSHGLSFNPTRDYTLDERFPFGCLKQGHRRYAYNRLHGSWRGRELIAFDYHYETYSYDSKGRRRTHHHHFSAVILKSQVPLKPLFIRPEGLFDKITEFLGFDDIDFESIEFSREFYVKAPDKRWAYDVLHPRAMEFLLNSPRFSIQFDGDWAIAYRSSRFSPEEFGEAAEVLYGIFERLPRYLKEQQRQVGEG